MQIALAVSNGLLDFYLRRAAFTPPSEWWAALLVELPDDAGAGASEVSGSGYQRMQVSFGAAAARVSTTEVNATYPQAQAGWGSVVGIALYDSASEGTLHLWDAFPAPVVITQGQQPRIVAGQLSVEVK